MHVPKVKPDRLVFDYRWKSIRAMWVNRWVLLELGKFHFRFEWSPIFSFQLGWNCTFWYTGALLSYSWRSGFSYLWKHEWDDV